MGLPTPKWFPFHWTWNCFFFFYLQIINALFFIQDDAEKGVLHPRWQDDVLLVELNRLSAFVEF